MTRLFNDPKNFAQEFVDGFVRACPHYVRKVYGGIVRSTQSRAGKVAVISGGGGGHFPAFAGFVGQGFLDGAVTGNIFASPSASQVASVAKAADQGGGVLLGFMNYAGDVLHFGQAAERLRAEGIEVRTAVTTDDIASASDAERSKRRGIAGSMHVLRVASGAAEAGLDLDEVTRLFVHANENVRTFGVAFSGCTLPGAEGPLFTVPEQRIGVGLGIHGEPGIEEIDLATSDEVARLLVTRLVAEAPQGAGKRVVVQLNGLGSAKYEELYVTYGAVLNELQAAGLEVVEGEVGEFMTSLDMGGVSLTVMWLDDELELHYFSECDTVAYRRRLPLAEQLPADVEFSVEAPLIEVGAKGGEESRRLAGHIALLAAQVAEAMETAESHLGAIDAVAGDGDHGIGMVKGSAAAAEAARELAEQGGGALTVLVGAGDRWAEASGGASGALWGAALTAAGNVLGNDRGADLATQLKAVKAFVSAIERLGGASLGDKTMLDAQLAFASAFETGLQKGGSATEIWEEAARAAEDAATNTAQLEPKLGRARVLAQRSIGWPDPGAVSFGIIATTAAEAVRSGGEG